MMKPINKILIANRGEIAVRIIRTAKEMNICTLAIYAQADKNALFVHMADEAVFIDGDELSDTYLNIGRIIEIAKKHEVKAIHPGYGFLSENEHFAHACTDNNILFIGPQSKVIRIMGNKIEARQFVKGVGVPLVDSIYGSQSELIDAVHNIEMPVLVKAAAGGGGKGMRIVRNTAELPKAIEATSREAQNYFGNPEVYIEKYIENPRHIEVQIVGDEYGKIIHLYERECSVQRRYQKIIEESPSVSLTPETRKKICDAAVAIATKAGYQSAGTIEFLLDEKQNFYFLEMNTRIQVEHPVTEMVTGIDIVKLQIDIASGKALQWQQTDIKQNGHAVECRIYAEKPMNNFLPSPGEIELYQAPEGKNIRIDSSINKATTIHSMYDPMISKLIVCAESRSMAIRQMNKYLKQYIIHGIDTNIEFLGSLMRNKNYFQNRISTSFCDSNITSILQQSEIEKKQIETEILAVIFLMYRQNRFSLSNKNNVWHETGYWRHIPLIELLIENQQVNVHIKKESNDDYTFGINNNSFCCHLITITDNYLRVSINNKKYAASLSCNESTTTISVNGQKYKATYLLNKISTELTNNSSGSSLQHKLHSPMPGKVLKINVKEGDNVKQGDVLAIVEAMKMENNILAPVDAIIKRVNAKINESVDTNKVLMELEKSKDEHKAMDS